MPAKQDKGTKSSVPVPPKSKEKKNIIQEVSLDDIDV